MSTKPKPTKPTPPCVVCGSKDTVDVKTHWICGNCGTFVVKAVEANLGHYLDLAEAGNKKASK